MSESEKNEGKGVAAIVKAAMASGVIQRETSLSDAVERLGKDIDQVAGYVCAWDKYVLVVAHQDLTPEVTFKRK